MCFNWKILAGLGAAGAALYVARPEMALSALPFLLIAACPLSMLLMLLMGKRMMGHQPTQPAQPSVVSPATGRAEEVVRFRADLAALNVKQAELARQLEQLDGARVPSTAVREAEEVARAAESRR